MLPSSLLCPGVSDQEEASCRGASIEFSAYHSFAVVNINIVKKQVRHDERNIQFHSPLVHFWHLSHPLNELGQIATFAEHHSGFFALLLTRDICEARPQLTRSHTERAKSGFAQTRTGEE